MPIEELPELELEHAENEVVLRGLAILWVGREIYVDKLVLDTGLGFGIAAPPDALAPNDLDECGPTIVHTLGDNMRCELGSAELRLGRHWRIPVLTVLGLSGRDWLVGYPVLRHFDLLLRSDGKRPPRLRGPVDRILAR